MQQLLLLLLLSRFSCVQLCATSRWQPTRLHRPWDSLGKNTGVGCHFLLQCMKVKSESEVAQLCPTLSDPMNCSPPGSSVHGIFQARVLEWGAIAFSHAATAEDQIPKSPCPTTRESPHPATKTQGSQKYTHTKKRNKEKNRVILENDKMASK